MKCHVEEIDSEEEQAVGSDDNVIEMEDVFEC